MKSNDKMILEKILKYISNNIRQSVDYLSKDKRNLSV